MNARYLINEKAALGEAQGFPLTLTDLSGRIDAVWDAIGRRDFEPALEALQRLDSDLRARCVGA